jgi:phosphate starvation-inducible PhoH-like protein
MNNKPEPVFTETLELDDTELRRLFGPLDHQRKDLEQQFRVSLVARREQLLVRGRRVDIDDAVKEIRVRLRDAEQNPNVIALPSVSRRERGDGLSAAGHPPTGSASGPIILHTTNKTPISARSRGQRDYVEAISDHDIVFGIGPAGTGKTYLAVAMAVAALKRRDVTRVVLARPAVEAGENLGFLPGDLKEKVDPYLRPLYDALYEMIAPDKLRNYLETHVIEIVPLAFMRGRTLNSAFVILDEAQNTTARQMKMFLTRLGADSKAVITGDITQIDLPDAVASGLIEAQLILSGISGISFVKLTERDVVRHRLVQLIIRAYDRVESSRNGNGDTTSRSQR